MLNEAKLQGVVATFAKYNIEVKTEEMRITAINGNKVDFDAKTYMQDQLIGLICKVLETQVVHEVWMRESAKPSA